MNEQDARKENRDDDASLLKLLIDEEAPLSAFWRSIRAGVFVTIYKRLPPSSENVYCCMSNGDYEPHKDLQTNVAESATICRTEDSRTFGGNPVANEICLFAPQYMWRALGNGESAVKKMLRERQRALMVRTDTGGAIFLPEVWDERPQWSAQTLLRQLTQKAQRGRKEKKAEIVVFEIPCFTVADPTISVLRHDRGFFAAVILKRCYQFYESFRSGPLLAYSVSNEVEYSTGKRNLVRSFADVSAFWQLSERLRAKKPLDMVASAMHWDCAQKSKEEEIACLAAQISFLINVQRTDVITEANVERLLEGFPTADIAFANPQIVIALTNYYGASQEQRKNKSEAILRIARQFCSDAATMRRAVHEHGAFAANWTLQAIAACRKHFADATFDVDRSVEQMMHKVCRDAIEKANSVTEQACAAHGLLAAKVFDHVQYDWLAESWARLQFSWLKESNGGFRYRVDEPWYRTDVTSHIVVVCLLLLEERETVDGHRKKLTSLGL